MSTLAPDWRMRNQSLPSFRRVMLVRLCTDEKLKAVHKLDVSFNLFFTREVFDSSQCDWRYSCPRKGLKCNDGSQSEGSSLSAETLSLLYSGLGTSYRITEHVRVYWASTTYLLLGLCPLSTSWPVAHCNFLIRKLEWATGALYHVHWSSGSIDKRIRIEFLS